MNATGFVKHSALIMLTAAALSDLAVGAADLYGHDRCQELLDQLPVQLKDTFIVLKSDVSVPDLPGVAQKIQSAYDFDAIEQGIQDLPLGRRPLQVGLVSEEAAQAYVPTGFGGRALGDAAYLCHAKGWQNYDPQGFELPVAAHELEHVLVFRMTGRGDTLPVYLNEGIANCLSWDYCRKNGVGNRSLDWYAGMLSHATADDAADVFTRMTTPGTTTLFKREHKLALGEALGGFFMQFVAHKVADSPRAFYRRFRVVCMDSPRGTLESTWQREYGLSLPEAQQRFLAFMRQTQGNPQARFQGTALEGHPLPNSGEHH